MKNNILKIFLIINCVCNLFSLSAGNKKNCETMDIRKMIQPVPFTAIYSEDSSFVWCGTMLLGQDRLYHLFYSRWPVKYGFNAWVTNSEIAHAVSKSPTGPFKFNNVILPARGKQYWDGLCTHNPTVHFFKGKYYLYYVGNTGDGIIPYLQNQAGNNLNRQDIDSIEKKRNGLNWIHRNNQRIGVAVADNPEGPWKRSDTPLLDVSEDSTVHDALMVSNPSVTEMCDGKYLMVYKAVAKKNILPFGGPIVHLTAISGSPEGPFVKQNKPIFTSEGTSFAAEDPCIWYQDGSYYAIVKDMQGVFTHQGKSLALFCSKDGFDWKLARHSLVSNLEVLFEDGSIRKFQSLERPQLYFEKGKPVIILLAGQIDKEHTFNIQIPLK